MSRGPCSASHFGYEREDHVRSLFRFAHGMQLDPKDLPLLAIHCANCEGSTDKKPWGERVEWADENRSEIQKIAADPIGTFEIWQKVDKPFAFVAAERHEGYPLGHKSKSSTGRA
jgi:DNA-directed RNA polymerase